MNQRNILLLKEFIPPIIVSAFKRLNRAGIGYKGNYSTWEEAIANSSGYDQPSILAKTKEATLKVKQGKAVYERDSVLFDHIEYALPVVAGLMLAAAKSEGRLCVLDFGGSLGSTYFQNRKFLNEIPDVQWGIVEQPHYVSCGQDFIQDKRLRFYNTINDCLAELKPNVVLLSGALQYLSNPIQIQILEKISQIHSDYLIIDRTPFSKLDSDKIIVQQVPSSIYTASYPLWIFSRKMFNGKVGNKWQLIEEFEGPWGSLETDTGIKFNYQGMIYRLLKSDES